MPNRPDHFEIPADDPEKLLGFYNQLLGWRFTKVPGFDYWSCKTSAADEASKGIDGAITKKQFAGQSLTNYISVADMEAVLGKVEGMGGKVVVPRSAVAGMGWFAIVLDPEQNPIGFWQADSLAE